MSDLVTIECPNCGGKMVRKADEYFAKCQFCGGEVCFDEIKEEVQLGVYKKKINKYENTINSYEKDYANDESKRKALKQWMFKRNVSMAVSTIVTFSGLGVMEYDAQLGREFGDTWYSTVGLLCFFFGLAAQFVIPFTLSAIYPAYDLLNRTNEKGGKAKMLVKLLLTSLLLSFLATMAATIIVILITE